MSVVVIILIVAVIGYTSFQIVRRRKIDASKRKIVNAYSTVIRYGMSVLNYVDMDKEYSTKELQDLRVKMYAYDMTWEEYRKLFFEYVKVVIDRNPFLSTDDIDYHARRDELYGLSELISNRIDELRDRYFSQLREE